jgi:hypothetical protein
MMLLVVPAAQAFQGAEVELGPIAGVRFDVVDHLGSDNLALGLTPSTEGVALQVERPQAPPAP